MPGFGSFEWLCEQPVPPTQLTQLPGKHAPLPQCNLFFSQLFNYNPGSRELLTLFPASSPFFSYYNVTAASRAIDPNVLLAVDQAGTGIGQNCSILRVQHGGSGDIGLVVVSGLAFLLGISLVIHAGLRKAAVARDEHRILLVAFAILSALQAVTMSSMLKQGSTALVVLSSLHLALSAAFGYILIANALVACQFLEDGSIASLTPLGIFVTALFTATLYISLSTGFHWNSVFFVTTNKLGELKNTPLFVLTVLWPVVRLTTQVSARKVGGSIIWAIGNTLSLALIHATWDLITEDEWSDTFDRF
ncbi:uncharacterized protein LOC62_02G002332 [Vanrija pseudolonga]|uniref:Chitin synthase export chaperone n=1 Tax=Vanrija pseudolonga TaxID=143232 RepID=A0AAF1BJU8_9TREE|nr:hypothetical protein LOC62_02G002332 [Vanrija pseudolonga]